MTLVKSLPLLRGKCLHGAAGCIDSSIAFLGETLYKLFDRTGAVALTVIPAAEHLKKRPLRPFVVLWIAGAHFTGPVIGESYAVHLAAVTGDIDSRSTGGMLARLDSILLSGEAERVVAHRMQDVESLQSLVTAVYVTGDIAERMPDVQTRA